jgi:hypothetical protein
MWRRHLVINDDVWCSAYNLARDAAIEVIGRNNWRLVYNSTSYPALTYELIAMHLLFERGHSLTFVPLIKDL